jgi:hypothetical protein
MDDNHINQEDLTSALADYLEMDEEKWMREMVRNFCYKHNL